MPRLPALTLALLLPLAACAPLPIDGARLEALAVGQTYAVQADDRPPYAIISFLPDRRTTWYRYDTDTCYAGVWQEPRPGYLCFTLQNPTRTSCWTYFETGGRLTMQTPEDPGALYSYSPMPDTGPCTPDPIAP